MSKRPISVCSRGSASSGGSPTRRSSSASSSVSPSGAESCGGFGNQGEGGVARGFGRGELLLGLLERRLHGTEGLELLRCRLALQLRAPAELVDTSGSAIAPALVRLEQRVELLGRAFSRERGAPGVGVAACGLEVDHEVESRRARRYLPATDETYAATSAICWSVSVPLNGGIAPPTVRHRVDDLVVARLRVVEVRPDVSARARVRERVAAAAAPRRRGRLLAGDRVAFGAPASVSVVVVSGRRSSPWSRSSRSSPSLSSPWSSS